ncbi:hypothetical protein VTJ83DRAFT_3240 [Remersonia thermophila]|uniref:DUF676 domain-containing protein n=1 Tax=Remersonia thermophila TaxID=72144 RepID=A0ABR4DFQ8_9PEZI
MAAPPPSQQPAPAVDTCFFQPQIGDRSSTNYAYTDLPGRLIVRDIVLFFRCAWALPHLFFPFTRTNSAELSELEPTLANFHSLAIHLILSALQLSALISLPWLFPLPVWVAAALVAGFLLVNRALCSLLDGPGVEFHSDPKYAPALPEHAHEQWIYINGVMTGSHWMQTNINRLAVTFKRPILGIHNKTYGLLLDILECLIQRNLGYATTDVRVCYQIIKQKLYNPQYSKIVLILHSQGGIQGSLILDWLLQETPQDLLSKLEIYTFGNAASHFNNPHRRVSTERQARKAALAASNDPAGLATPPQASDLTRVTDPCDPPIRAIRHIEHYAHARDFVALWGVSHFAASPPPVVCPHTKEAAPELLSSSSSQDAIGHVMIPRFAGRLFVRAGPLGTGHLLVRHYLDGMFTLREEKDENGVPLGVADGDGENEFMESEVALSGGVCENGTRRGEGNGSDLGLDQGGGEVNGLSPVRERRRGRGTEGEGKKVQARMKVKELSRLWQYRNGRSPEDVAPSSGKGSNRVARG